MKHNPLLTHELILKKIRKGFSDLKEVKPSNIMLPETLTLGDRIQHFSYNPVGPDKFYAVFDGYYFTIREMSPCGDARKGSEENIIACFLYHKTERGGLLSGFKLVEVCVVVFGHPYHKEPFVRAQLEESLDDASLALTVVAQFVQKISLSLQ